jgi:putative integral membrane protein (TIGR02587 family)
MFWQKTDRVNRLIAAATPQGGGAAGRRGSLSGLGRALAGSLVFALPMLMTMEMWELGAHVDRLKLAVLLGLTLPLLVGLAHFIGFEATFDWREDVRDALAALTVAAFASAAILAIFGVVEPGMSLDEVVGKVALQAVPASIGALLASGQLGGEGNERNAGDSRSPGPQGYASELFFMATGALFLSFNVAPTEEMVLIAYRIGPWQELLLAAVSILAMHAFVYLVQFRGQEELPEGATFRLLFLRFTVVGYAIVLAISAYALWTFGRLEGTSLADALSSVVVLSFPGAIGAAGARVLF